MQMKRYSLALVAVLGLAACGGGGGGGSNTGGTTASGGTATGGVTYRTLDDTATAGASNVQIAFVTRSNGTPSSTTQATGTLDRPSQELTVNGVIVGGARTNDTWSEGNNRVSKTTAGGLTGTYDFFAPVTVTQDNGVTTDVGVVGVQTAAGEMPTSGTATFTGEANVTQITTGLGAGTTNSAASLAVDVDFAANQADVKMTSVTGLGFDEMNILNARVNGAAIDETGATVEFKTNGAAVTPIGTQSGTSVDGSFYGLRASDSIPEEAGGVFAVTGSSGSVSGVFAAGSR